MNKAAEQDQRQEGASSTCSHSAEQTLTTLMSVSYRAGDLQNYLDSICEIVLDLLGDGLSAITLYRDGAKHVLARCPERGSVPNRTMDVHGQLSTHVVNNNAVLKVADAIEDNRYGKPPEGFCSYMGVPLRIPSGEVVGTLCYFDRGKRQYTERDEQTAQLFAERAAIALDNYQMYQKLEEHSDSLEVLVQERTEQLLAMRDELAHKEKLAAVGEFATQITHEIRNPLTTIRLTLEYLQNHPDKDPGKRVELAVGEVARLERMLNEVLVYAKPVQADTCPIELSSFCQDFITTYGSIAAERKQYFELEIDSKARVLADRDKLTQILLNLIRNACEAAEPEQTISLQTRRDTTHGIVTVHNFGDCVPINKLPHITEPFVSGKPNGCGLGLAIVATLAEAQGGRVEISSDNKDGTTVSLYLPLEMS